MKVTIRLDDQLLTEAKRLALESGQTLTAVIEEALRCEVARHKKAPEARKAKLVTDGGRGLRPGVRLDSNAGLLDTMERRRWDSR